MATITPQFVKKVFVINVDRAITEELKRSCISFLHQLGHRAALSRPAAVNRSETLKSARQDDSLKSGRRDSTGVTGGVLRNGTKSESETKPRVTFRDDVTSPDSDWSRPLRTLRERRLSKSYDGSGIEDLKDKETKDKESALDGSHIDSRTRSSIERLCLKNHSVDEKNNIQLRSKSRESPFKREKSKTDDVTVIRTPRKRVEYSARDTPDHEWDDPESDYSPAKSDTFRLSSRRYHSLPNTFRADRTDVFARRSSRLRKSSNFSEIMLQNPDRYIDVDESSFSYDYLPTDRTIKYEPSRRFSFKQSRRGHGGRRVWARDLSDVSRWEDVRLKSRPRGRRSLINRHVWLKEAVNFNTVHDPDDWYNGSDSGNETDDELT